MSKIKLPIPRGKAIVKRLMECAIYKPKGEDIEVVWVYTLRPN